jgi:hypothetical protein
MSAIFCGAFNNPEFNTQSTTLPTPPAVIQGNAWATRPRRLKYNTLKLIEKYLELKTNN